MNKRPRTFTDEDGNEHNGEAVQDAYERAQEDKFEREREERDLISKTEAEINPER